MFISKMRGQKYVKAQVDMANYKKVIKEALDRKAMCQYDENQRSLISSLRMKIIQE